VVQRNQTIRSSGHHGLGSHESADGWRWAKWTIVTVVIIIFKWITSWAEQWSDENPAATEIPTDGQLSSAISCYAESEFAFQNIKRFLLLR
jgi:hypothetical protein